MSELTPNESEFILYTNDNGEVKLSVLVLDETVWLTQEGMQELFGRSKSTISEHISNVFKEGELDENSVVRKFRTTTQHEQWKVKRKKTGQISTTSMLYDKFNKTYYLILIRN